MKYLYIIFLYVIVTISISAQPKSIHYQKDDFFMDVIYNPNASLYQFLAAGLTSKNTELKDLHIYANSKVVQNKCRELNISISESYYKIKASWEVFLEIENIDLSYNGFGKYMIETYPQKIFGPSTCPNPELKHKLSIVPLKLEDY